jgi:hypothetical protein
LKVLRNDDDKADLTVLMAISKNLPIVYWDSACEHRFCLIRMRQILDNENTLEDGRSLRCTSFFLSGN